VSNRLGQADDPGKAIELGEEVSIKSGRSAGPVVAVRMPRDLFARVSEYARARNTTVSDVLRQGAESLVNGVLELGPTYVTGVTAQGPAVVSGSPSIGTSYLWADLVFKFRSEDEPDSLWAVEVKSGHPG
jgi:hypothetical protein